MHYFQHNINDWRAETRHLSLIESAIYSELVDEYLSNEEPITSDLPKLQKRIRVKTKSEKDALAYVLEEFFYLSEAGDCYRNEKLDDMIKEFQENTEAKSRAGRASAKARKSASSNKQDESSHSSEDKQDINTKGAEVQQESNSDSTEDEQKLNTNEQVFPNHKPITINHKPNKKTNKKRNPVEQKDDGANAPGVCFSDEDSEDASLDDVPIRTLDRGAIASYCRSQGINASSTQALQKVLDLGATMQHFVDAVAIAKEKGNASWPYVLGIAKNLAIEDQKPVAAPEPRVIGGGKQRFNPEDFLRAQSAEITRRMQGASNPSVGDSSVFDVEAKVIS
ncbi:YdaU family protein [Oligella sp. HMSC09E12]|uniref:YdaU family protein n=1 Tax=Oligella sp. HMSC09E12 TaxID=1581147 RepID=UPI0008A47BA5|nr:YdaU family protein [Oligella sp. HMSC09E12]OFV50057.1 hypothetical protein HMPREF3179_03065 [Oligella sp. HMSC09E12]